MVNQRESGRLLLAVLLLVCVTFSSCFTKDDTDKANKLVAESNEELKSVTRIYEDSEKKVVELKKAIAEENVEQVKVLLGDLITMIDQGLSHGRIAAVKSEEAAKLNLGKEFKQYLDLKSQSYRKQIEAFEERKKSAEVFRSAYGTQDKEQMNKAKQDFSQATDKYKQLLDDAKDLSERANKIAREYPNKIKSVSDR